MSGDVSSATLMPPAGRFVAMTLRARLVRTGRTAVSNSSACPLIRAGSAEHQLAADGAQNQQRCTPPHRGRSRAAAAVRCGGGARPFAHAQEAAAAEW